MRRLALVIALLAACDDDGGPISIDDLPAELTNAFCNLYVNCGLIEDHSTCRSLYLDLDVDESLIAAVDAGKVIYHEDKARECLSGVGASCERASALSGTNTEACDETFEGTVGAGGQCAMNEECKSRDCDVPACPDACCQGTCVGDVATPRPRVGESCLMNTQCVDSYCDFTSNTCLAIKPIGATCTASRECGADVCANQVCTKRPGPGEACNNGTVGGQCNLIGYTCSPTSLTCVPVGLSGDPCTSQSECSEVYNCGPSGTCVLGPRLGETCGEIEGNCIDNSYCDFSTLKCTAPKPDGAACDADNECQSDVCDSGGTNTCVTEPICI